MMIASLLNIIAGQRTTKEEKEARLMAVIGAGPKTPLMGSTSNTSLAGIPVQVTVTTTPSSSTASTIYQFQTDTYTTASTNTIAAAGIYTSGFGGSPSQRSGQA